MKNNLILTGWSKSEYLAAAAVAFEVLKADADVAGVSMEALAGVLSSDAAKYKTVYVLGVGLTKNIGAIVAALAMLKKVQVFDKNHQNLTATKEALGISLNTLKKYLA